VDCFQASWSAGCGHLLKPDFDNPGLVAGQVILQEVGRLRLSQELQLLAKASPVPDDDSVNCLSFVPPHHGALPGEALLEGISQRIQRGVDSRLKRSILLYWRPGNFLF
jgi:hypothetical protein